jgi:hypothetical protein
LASCNDAACIHALGQFLAHWLSAWLISWVVMLPFVLFAAPFIRRLSVVLTREELERATEKIGPRL